MAKPLVAITGPRHGAYHSFIGAAFSVLISGGVPKRFGVGRKGSFDALVVSGGSDINPALYGGDTHNTRLDEERDEYELELIARALEESKPILGICRGAQLLNVHFKGTLYPTILSFDEEIVHYNSIFPIKKVYISKDSILKEIVGGDEIIANSLHNQAIFEVHEPLKVVARTENSIVQAIESTDERFILGVQWHPEYIPYIRSSRKIFKKLIQKCKS